MNNPTNEAIVAEAMVEAGASLMHSRVEENVVQKLNDAGRLNSMQMQVREFHAAMGQPVGLWPRQLDADRHAVRIELIREEFEELRDALSQDDMVETADACIDILYVTLGLLVEMGINVVPLFDEVQASNMSKLGANGKPIIAGPNDPDGIFEGRVKKGPNYFRPNLKAILESGKADLGRVE